MLRQAIKAKNNNWLQISQKDVDKIGMKVLSVFVSLDEDKIRIVWQTEKNIWEAIRKCNGSLKKLICETIYNPSYRGALSLLKAHEKIQGNIITCDLDEVDLYKPEVEIETATD